MSGTWPRVTGPDLDQNNLKRKAKNKAVRESEIFIEACKNAGVEPTKRQSSKWSNGKGLALKMKGEWFKCNKP